MFVAGVHQLSPVLLAVLSHAVDWERLQRDRYAFAEVCRAVTELSELFTRGGDRRNPHYLADPRLRHAYLTYFLPVNLAKIQALLEEMPVPETTARPSFHVLDIGGGPGTGVLAVLDWLPQSNIDRLSCHIETIDRGAPLRETQRFFNAYRTAVKHAHTALSAIEADLEGVEWSTRIRATSYDLIVVANVLNELYVGRRNRLERRIEWVTLLLDRLDRHGSLILIEPALRSTARDLHELRDRLVRAGAASVYSPCVHQQSCPALVKEDDWCHEERPWLRPPWIAAIDREVGFIKDALKFSYLILRKDDCTIAASESDVYRVVSEVRRLKGDTRAWLCNGSGRPEIGRLERARSEANAALDDWHRGAIVRLQDIEWKETPAGRRMGRVRPTSTVEMIRPVR